MSSDGRVEGGKIWRKEDGKHKEREMGMLRLRKVDSMVLVRVYALWGNAKERDTMRQFRRN